MVLGTRMHLSPGFLCLVFHIQEKILKKSPSSSEPELLVPFSLVGGKEN